jgi:subtilisin family serine protease
MDSVMRLIPALAVAVVLAVPAKARAGEGDIIVQREPGSSAREVRQDAEVRRVNTLPIERTELVEPRDGDVAEALAELRADDDVVSAEADIPVRGATPNDPFWISLWALDNAADNDIDAPEAWLRSVGAGATVAVVDTGVNFTHEDLQDQLVGNPGEQGDGRESNRVDDDHDGLVDDHQGWDFVSEDNTPQDGNGHGTHVAGTIAASGENSAGVIGVAPQARVLPVRALDNNGSGWMSDIAAAFAYAGDMGARIVNASLGGGYTVALKNVIAAHPNTLYVVAASNDAADNDNPSLASYPCALPEPNVLCVGASDQNDQRAGFSNWGATTVDVFAPGVSIRSTSNTGPNAYKYLSGTSMATPHVAGAAALALAASPSSTTSQLKWELLSSADVKPALAGTSVTGGRLNADRAVAAITGQGPLAVPSPEPTATPVPVVETPVATPTPVVEPPVVETPAPVAPVATPVVTPVATPAPAVWVAPQLSRVKVGGSLLKKTGKLKVTFSLSGTADVRFTVARRGKKLASWTKRGVRGANRVTLTRRLPTGRTLKAGAYTLAVGLNASAKTAAIRVR